MKAIITRAEAKALVKAIAPCRTCGDAGCEWARKIRRRLRATEVTKRTARKK